MSEVSAWPVQMCSVTSRFSCSRATFLCSSTRIAPKGVLPCSRLLLETSMARRKNATSSSCVNVARRGSSQLDFFSSAMMAPLVAGARPASVPGQSKKEAREAGKGRLACFARPSLAARTSCTRPRAAQLRGPKRWFLFAFAAFTLPRARPFVLPSLTTGDDGESTRGRAATRERGWWDLASASRRRSPPSRGPKAGRRTPRPRFLPSSRRRRDWPPSWASRVTRWIRTLGGLKRSVT